ncbi:related to mitochondrial integral membrane protein [Cephalotrichum gorgonifer]|uniref:Related to mitochondrial integral membrane protein n=1 Tax=Cephalotrichum gorgonifer TaxID=2041049 RepID=A0AAE8MRR1_9PEZI|nr:related to mitochondrial integral membrane protein [Cephalotrichum gorgonifer]
MPSLWGTSRDDDHDADAGEHDNGRSEDDSRSRADERTRLLPNQANNSTSRLLTPDDPAVSPYNLWAVRVLRYVTLFMTLFSFVWWSLLLIAIFATPPGLETRGSGFFALSNASIALCLLISKLVFFGTPSKSSRILCACMALALLVNSILTLAVQMVRYEEGWVGTVSVLWALLMSLWVLLADRTVRWGKEEEEVRLTGRAETRRTLTEWSSVLLETIGLFILAIAIVLMTLTLMIRSVDAGVAPPGKLYWVDGGKYRMHVCCEGDGAKAEGNSTPTVLLEGGEMPVGNGLRQLARDALKNGSISRYCFVDRPGVSWSDTAPSPLSAGMEAVAASEALAKAGERGPWVVASAGVGSYYSRVFVSQHSREVKGLLLIDALHDDDLARLGSPRRGFLLWLWGFLSPLGLDTLPAALFRGRGSVDRIRGVSARHNPKNIFARLQESLVADSFTKRDVEGSRAIMRRSTPLTVITSGKHAEKDKGWKENQRDLTMLTENLQHWDVVDDAPHEVWETLEGRRVIEERLREMVRHAE